MRRLQLLALFTALLFSAPALSQTNTIVNFKNGTNSTQVSAANPLPVNATVSASVSGFAPSLAYATCTAAGTACASTALPTNTGTVVLFNTGTTTVSCTLAAGAATALANELQIPASSGLPLGTVSGATTYDHFSCIDQTGSTSNVVVASGGTGLGTGWGGGGAGGGGGAVTLASGAVSSGAYSSGSIASGAYASGAFASGAAASGSWSDGSIVTLGAKADTACATAPCSTNGWLAQIHADAQAGTAVNGATYPASSIGIAGKDPAGNIQPILADPCSVGPKIYIPISQTTSTKLVSAAAAKKNYVCAFSVVAGDAENLSLMEGTGTVCASATQTGIIGSTTAAAGPNFAANGGMTLGNGQSSVAAGATVNTDVCLLQSGTGRVAGSLVVVQF